MLVHKSLGIIALAITCLCITTAQATPTDRIIIKVSESMRPAMLADGAPAPRARERVSSLSAAAGHEMVYLRAMSGGADVLSLPRTMPLEQVQAMAEAMAQLPGVEYAEPDVRVFTMTLPNDERFDEQWNLQAVKTTAPLNYGIDTPGAWAITTGNPVTVAVLDTGILVDHWDLAEKILPGYDFFDRDDDPSDPGDYVTEDEATKDCLASKSSWHGTHIAGIIAAATNNGVGVAGISWGARILPVRVLGKCGGSISDIADAMRWSVGIEVPGVDPNPNPARILNLSLGAKPLGEDTCTQTFRSAIQDVNATGAIIVVSSGNEGQDLTQAPITPAVCPGVVTVAATDPQGRKASYSSFGGAVDISAPGGECFFVDDTCFLAEGLAILSTLNSGATDPIDGGDEIGGRIGTSMATPHVAGVAALMLGYDPDLTREELIYLLRANVTAFPDSSNCATNGGCGTGIVNAALALQATEVFEGLPPAPASSGGGGAPSSWLLGMLLAYAGLLFRNIRKLKPQTAPASAP